MNPVRAASRLLLLGLALLAVSGLFACTKSLEDVAREHRQRGDAFLHQGKYREASLEYQSALQSLPNDVDSLYGLARVLDHTGAYSEYRARLREILDLDDTHLPAILELGQLHWAGGDYAKAQELAGKVLAIDATSIGGLKLQARTHATLAEVEQARDAWQAVLDSPLRADEDFVEAAQFFARVDADKSGLFVLDQGLEAFPDSVPLLLAKVGYLTNTGQFEEAGPLLEQVMAVAEDDPEVHAVRAKYLIRRGQVDEARQELTKAQARFAEEPKKSARMAVLRARIYIRMGDVHKAREVLEGEWERNRTHPQLAATLADVLITLGQTDQALELLSVAAKLDAGARTARLLAARLYLHDGRSALALQVLERLVANGDLRIDTHLMYAKALTRERRWALARMEYLLVLRRVPDHHLARIDYAGLLLELDAPEDGLAVLEPVPAAIRDTPTVRLLRARLHLAAQQLPESRALLEQLHQEIPSGGIIVKMLGDVERAAGGNRAALRRYRQAQELNPGSWAPLHAEVDLLRETGEPLRGLVTRLGAFQEQYGDSPMVQNYIAQLYLDAGDLQMAHRYLERSSQLEPNYWATRFLRSRVLQAEGETAKASVALVGAIDLAPEQPHAYNELAAIHESLGDLAEAERLYLALLEKSPGEPGTANNLANLYLRQERLEEGLRMAKMAYAGAPRNLHVLDTLGWALELNGQSDDASGYLREAAGALTDDAEVQFHWGVNLHSRGETTEAKQVLERVVRLAPESPAAVHAAKLL